MSVSIRTLIVDDDPTFRMAIRKALAAIDGVELVGSVGSIDHAKAKIRLARVDVVVLDVVLRDECGLDLLSWTREHHPRVLTALLTSGESQAVRDGVDAALLGAAACIRKPSGSGAAAELCDSLTDLFSSLARDRQKPRTQRRPSPTAAPVRPAVRSLIAVGASTGGPPVVVEFLKSLPAHFTVPIVITQHMAPAHLPFYVEMLARQSGRQVVMASHGQYVEPSVTYVAPGGSHLRVVAEGARLVLELDSGPEEHHCRPAVDPMFRSVAEVCRESAIGVVMTGMGSDGALGATALRQRGAPVVVQDRDTSIVWGMPGATVAAGSANAVVPAAKLSSQVLAWTRWSESER